MSNVLFCLINCLIENVPRSPPRPITNLICPDLGPNILALTAPGQDIPPHFPALGPFRCYFLPFANPWMLGNVELMIITCLGCSDNSVIPMLGIFLGMSDSQTKEVARN